MDGDPGVPESARLVGSPALIAGPGPGPPGPSSTEQLLDTLLDAHVAMDEAGLVVDWNPAAERLLGWTRDEALGCEAAELFLPESYRADHRAGLERVRTTGRSHLAGKRLELVAVHRSGRQLNVELTIQIDPRGAHLFHGFLHDITERQRAHRQLLDREMFLRSLIDSLDVGILACGPDGRLVVANEALRHAQSHAGQPESGTVDVEQLAERYCLYRPDGLTLLGPEELPLTRALQGEEVDGQELVMRPAGRPAIRYRVAGRRVHSYDGALLGAVVELHDVTAAYDAALMHSGMAAFAMETTGIDIDDESLGRGLSALAGELQWSRAGYWTTGAAGELTLSSGWQPGNERVWQPALAQAARDGGDLAWLQEDGDTPLRTVAFPVTSGNRTIGVLEFSDDGHGGPAPALVSLLLTISAQVARHQERRRAEDLAATLAEERATLDRVLHQVDDHVWSIELLEDGLVRPGYASSSIDRIFGTDVPDGAHPGTLVLERMHPDDVPRFQEYLRRGQEGQVADVEVRIRGLDDEVRWYWVRGIPRHENGRRFVDGISTDITERRELQAERERLLHQSQEQTERRLAQLHELDRLKDEFLATISHELRSPVAVIQGYADLVIEDPTVPASVRPMVEVIRRRTQQLHRLVEELFAHARIEAGLVDLQRRPVDVDRFVGELCRSHEPAAAELGLTLEQRLDCAGQVSADETRLRQILDNVVGNALKYTPAGGRVTVSTAARPGEVTVEVADTGIGVPEEERARIFEKLYRASSAREHAIEGTGLGLAVTKSLVEAHGGTVSVAARPGGGTLFTVRLPAGETAGTDA